MLLLKRMWNYKNVIYSAGTIERIGILRSDESYHYLPFIGFIEVNKIGYLPGAVKVMVEMHQYNLKGSFAHADWVSLDQGAHLLGVKIEAGVFVVTKDGIPAVI